MKGIKLDTQKDFSGGLNLRADPFELGKNESPDCLNVDFDPRGGITQRRGVGEVALTVATPNLLTANEADIETSTAGWTAKAKCVLAQSATFANHSTNSLRVTCNSAGTVLANVTRLVPVTASQQYTVSCWIRPGSTVRNVLVRAYYYDVSAAFISSSAGTPAAEVAATWTNIYVRSVAPSNATHVVLEVEIQSAADTEIHYVDTAMVVRGGNDNYWLNPSATDAALIGGITNIIPFETTTGTEQHIFTTDGGGIWYATAGTYILVCLGAYGFARGTSFKDKLYLVGAPNYSISFAGSTQAAILDETFNDNLVVPDDNSMPKARYITSWRGLVWIAGTTESSVDHLNRVRFSHPNQPEDFRSTDFFDVDTGVDGDIITGMVPMEDRLLIFKRHAVYSVVGDDPTNFAVYPISREVGAVSQEAIVSTDIGVYFFSNPEGVMLFDGKGMSWQFERLKPLIDDSQFINDDVHLGWSGRRLYLALWQWSLPFGEGSIVRRCYVLDPTLSENGSWTVYDISVARMVEERYTSAGRYFLGVGMSPSPLLVPKATVLLLEPQDQHAAADTLAAGVTHITSYYRTRWVDLGQPAIVKRWKSPECVVRGGSGYELPVDLHRDYDPGIVAKTFALIAHADPSVFEWGDDWGEGVWGPAPTSSARNEVVRGSPLGQARSVALTIHGPTANAVWGVNAVTHKFIPRPPKS